MVSGGSDFKRSFGQRLTVNVVDGGQVCITIIYNVIMGWRNNVFADQMLKYAVKSCCSYYTNTFDQGCLLSIIERHDDTGVLGRFSAFG